VYILGVQNKLVNVDESIYIPITRAEFAVLISAFNVRSENISSLTLPAWTFKETLLNSFFSSILQVCLALPYRLACICKLHQTRRDKPCEQRFA